ncbi:hypothetical protein CK203_014679 [Vitis vinifera]|uniref:Uncharacterized protein n=1 Tax=Vitis vinifera TaxID=29760 RepID=A0A438JFZ5_VITVI|nr:hypothetical protein CK203_014679 [Vitis vinifera]
MVLKGLCSDCGSTPTKSLTSKAFCSALPSKDGFHGGYQTKGSHCRTVQALKKKNKYLAQICGDQPLEDPLQAISNIYDNTFLHLAIRFKQKDMVEELLRMLPKEGNHLLWKIKNKEGNTILHELACSDSMKDLAQEALKICKDKDSELLTARNELGETPIFCAARHGQTEMF